GSEKRGATPAHAYASRAIAAGTSDGAAIAYGCREHDRAGELVVQAVAGEERARRSVTLAHDEPPARGGQDAEHEPVVGEECETTRPVTGVGDAQARHLHGIGRCLRDEH